MWRVRSAQSIIYLSSPLKLPTILLDHFSTISESDSSRTSLGSTKDRKETVALNNASAKQSKDSGILHKTSTSYKKRSTLYGKCYEHTES